MFKSITKIRVQRCALSEGETAVQSGLAVTPAQMADLAAKGIPISPQAAGQEYYDGRQSNDYGIDVAYQRGVDLTDASMVQADTHRKIKEKLGANQNSQEYGR